MFEQLVASVVNTGILAIWAAVLAALGYIFGLIAEYIVKRIFKGLYYEEWLQRYNIDRAFLGIPVSTLLGILVKWWVFLGFFAQAVELFGLTYLTGMASALYSIYTSVALGIIYLAIGATIAKYVGDRMRAAKLPGGGFTVLAVQGIIMYFALVTAMPYFGIRNTYIITKAIEIALWAVAAAVGLGLAIAIGLGTQDIVKEIVQKKKDVIEAIIVGETRKRR